MTLPSEESLRRGAATALESALAFVDAQEDDFSRLRARALLQVRPASEVAEWIAGRQNPQGGIEPLGLSDAGALGLSGAWQSPAEDDLRGAHSAEENRSAQRAEVRVEPQLRGALEALTVLADLSLLHSVCVARAADYLTGCQLADGSWGVEQSTAAERLFPTGMLGGLLARTPCARPEVLAKASEFLTHLWSPKDVVEGGWSTLAGMLLHFTNVGGEGSEGVVSWCGRELERSFRAGRYNALETVKLLLGCGASALPGAQLGSAELLAALLAEQREDGSFGGSFSASRRTCLAPSVDAIGALLALCAQL